MAGTNCEECAYFTWDEDYECYVCEQDLDEDDLGRFIENKMYQCPFYRNGDEYAVVRKQAF